MDLAGLVINSGVKSLAVVGTAKNVGKTVTMNYLTSELHARGVTVGLVSSGRDGETTDSFTGEPKPSVVPPEGAWVATAEGVLGESGGLLEIADVSERPGLLGRLVLGKVREPAPLELVGPQSAKELALLVRRLHALGAQLVLVDGALDRVAAANPKVTDGAILATGAASEVNLMLIAESAGSVAWLWSRRRPENRRVREIAREAIDAGLISFLDEVSIRDRSGTEKAYAVRRTGFRTCLDREEDVLSQAKGASFVVVPGAVSRKFLAEAQAWPDRDDFAVIAKDPVSVFAQGDPGVPLFVDEEINLLAMTVNPVSHRGISYEPSEMVNEVSDEVFRRTGRNLPVFDVVSGENNMRGVAGVAMG